MRINLCGARHFNLCNMLMEVPSCHQVRLESRRVPWTVTDVVKKVIDLGKALEVSYFHVKRSDIQARIILPRKESINKL